MKTKLYPIPGKKEGRLIEHVGSDAAKVAIMNRVSWGEFYSAVGCLSTQFPEFPLAVIYYDDHECEIVASYYDEHNALGPCLCAVFDHATHRFKFHQRKPSEIPYAVQKWL